MRRILQLDGQPGWRPDAALLPPADPPDASLHTLLRRVPPNSTAWLAFGSAGVAEMLTNWAAHVIELGMGGKMLIAAFDEELLGTLRELGLPAYNYTGVLPPHHFRRAPYLFHRMGYLKATLIQQVWPPLTLSCRPPPLHPRVAPH